MKFGGRSGWAQALLGGIKIAVGLLFGSSLFTLLQKFPQSILGSLLLLSGIELAMSARRLKDASGWHLMLLTGCACLVTDTGIGFLFGLGTYIML